jgi:lipoate-protein ligase A
MPERTIRLVRDGFADRMSLDTAVSRVLLTNASRSEHTELLRLTVPGSSVAFGKHDAVSHGFPAAVAAARDAGFEPFVRLAGGRAAVFHQQTVAMSWVIPDGNPVEGIRARFSAAAGVLADAFVSLGIDAEIGPVPGEYCPGDFSIHVGKTKVAGLGQRLTRSAAHIGGVVVTGDGDAIRRALIPVYEALELDWDPSTAGALSDTVPGVDPDAVIDAIVNRLRTEFTVEEASLSSQTVAAAEGLVADFTPA